MSSKQHQQWSEIRTRLYDGLQNAFSDIPALRIMLRFYCDDRVIEDYISFNSTKPEAIAAILAAAERERWLKELIEGARSANETNRALAAAATDAEEFLNSVDKQFIKELSLRAEAPATDLPSVLLRMLHHEQLRLFDPVQKHYIPLPIEVVHLEEPLGSRIFDEPDAQTMATSEIMHAFRNILQPAAERAPDAPIEATMIGLIGSFGSNTTTQLQRLTWQTAAEAHALLEQDPDASIVLPLYIDFEGFKPRSSWLINSLEQFIMQSLRDFAWPTLTRQTLRALPPHVTPRLLFANLDNLLPEHVELVQQQLFELLHRYSDSRSGRPLQIVIVARHSSLDWKRLEEACNLHLMILQPLNNQLIRRMLERCDLMDALQRITPAQRHKLGAKLLNRLEQHELFDLVATPWFMLRVLLRAANDNQYPDSRTSILRDLFESKLKKLPLERGTRDYARRSLYELAYQIQTNENELWPIDSSFNVFRQVRAGRDSELDLFFDALLREDLLVALNQSMLRFNYRPLQAYCCAQAILQRPDHAAVLRDIVVTLGVSSRLRWWQDVLVIVCKLLAQGESEDAPSSGGSHAADGSRWRTLIDLLQSLIFGYDLLRDRHLFLVVRCLAECGVRWRLTIDESHPEKRLTAAPQPLPTAPDWAQQRLYELYDNVIAALRARGDSRGEPNVEWRATAMRMLGNMYDRSTLVKLAQVAVNPVRVKPDGIEDYEFSNVRLAAAAGLARLGALHNIEPLLRDASIQPVVYKIYTAWRKRDCEQLYKLFDANRNPGLQGLLALGIGDLSSGNRLDFVHAEKNTPIHFLGRQLLRDDLPQAVLWAVADGLAMNDSMSVTELALLPYFETRPHNAEGWLMRDKAVAYLTGLVRSQHLQARRFLVEECLQRSHDLKLWQTALRALGRLGTRVSVDFLKYVADGHIISSDILAESQPSEPLAQQGENFKTTPLIQRFPDDSLQMQQLAIELLTVYNDWEIIEMLYKPSLLRRPELARVLYAAVPAVYWLHGDAEL